MPGGAQPGSGRKPGSKNKATIERELRALELQSKLAVNAAQGGKKIAVDVLDDFMNLFAGMAATYQPWAPSQGKNPNESPELFFRAAELAVITAKALAKHQTPTLKAVQLMTPAPVIEQAPIGDNVVRLNDPVRASQVYARMMKAIG